MASLVLYSHEYNKALAEGTLAPETFDHYFLCEGDSWMDRSSPTQLSLPWALQQIFTGPNGDDALFINCSRFGDTLRHIGDCLNDDFHQWLTTPLPFQFDALLLSAGGNDFIDAALEPPPGQGILKDVHGAGANLTAEECFDENAIGVLVADYLDPNFRKLYDTVRGSPQGDLPILLNCYNTPVPRHAPAIGGGKSWLSRAYEKNGIPPALWRDVTERLFIDVEAAVTGWTRTDHRSELVVVPTSVVPLVPANPASTGSSGDWLNEIHPNRSGWNKLAQAWLQEIRKVLQ